MFLQVVQIPLAWPLARRLRQRLEEREVLLERAMQASEIERRQIASDLHGGVVQDLAGVAYSLSAAARSRNGTGPDQEVIDRSAEAVRASIRALRSLVVDIYPPDFGEEPLDVALGDLIERARARGVQAELEAAAAARFLTRPPGSSTGWRRKASATPCTIRAPTPCGSGWA